MLKLYSDRRYQEPGRPHVVMLYPFWGCNPENPGDPDACRFEGYLRSGSGYFSMTTLDDADVLVAPNEWVTGGENDGIHRLAEEAAVRNKPVVVFFNSDSEEPIDLPSAFIFRTSFYRSRRRPFEFALPAWSEDFLGRYLGGRLVLREKQPRPVVGYCGYKHLRGGWRGMLEALIGSRPALDRWFIRRGKQLFAHPGVRVRAQALHGLRHSGRVRTNFLIRQAFWNGATSGGLNPGLAQRSRREFVQNMIDSDYVLCARGAGNFSYRLYETLSCGRIPVFVDTDCVLPYNDLIDWQRCCVWVPQDNLGQIGESVAAFHSSLSGQDFRDLQWACRRLWEEWLCPQGFFANFARHFPSGSAAND